jgi:hypothetical protein
MACVDDGALLAFLSSAARTVSKFIDDEGWIPSGDASVESSGADLNRRHQMHRT